MAKLVLTNPSITIAGTDLSDHLNNISIESKYDIIETTTFGSLAKSRVAGLVDNQITLDFLQDFTATSVEATIYPLLGTTVSIVVKPVAGAVSATNPSYTVQAVVADWTPLKAAVGQLSTATVTWPISGSIVKAIV